MNEETTNPETTTDYPPAHCCVAHPDAGGPCAESFAVEVYGLNFCAAHGEEALFGAALEAGHDAENYFVRFGNPHVPDLPPVARRGLEAAVSVAREHAPDEEDYDRALMVAYRNAPEDVRERGAAWERDEAPEYESVLDVLLRSLHVVNRLMRIAHEEGETWLVEILERKRESVAAQTAVALERAQKEQEERESGVQPA